MFAFLIRLAESPAAPLYRPGTAALALRRPARH